MTSWKNFDFDQHAKLVHTLEEKNFELVQYCEVFKMQNRFTFSQVMLRNDKIEVTKEGRTHITDLYPTIEENIAYILSRL